MMTPPMSTPSRPFTPPSCRATMTAVVEPVASRPYMPGYGTLGPEEGTGLLPWSWAEEQLTVSHDYWLASVWPDGRPHLMTVWGMLQVGALWDSSRGRSRKM